MGWRGVLAQGTPPLKAAAKRRSQAEVKARWGAATRSLRSARGAAHSAAVANARWKGNIGRRLIRRIFGTNEWMDGWCGGVLGNLEPARRRGCLFLR
jgi:hypothetical protein